MSVEGSCCAGCELQSKGEIFIPFDGLGTNRVLLVGDSGWEHEARTKRWVAGRQVGTPFSGPSGWFIERNLKRIGANRSQFTIANSYWCKAPHLGFTDHPERHPDAALALEHCRPYLDDLIQRMKPSAIVPMGNVALRRITGCGGIEKHHAYYMSTSYGIPAIPTFHPSFIMRGQQKLSGPWCFAVERALKLASGKEKLKEYELLLDPPIDVARAYFEHGPKRLVCDIETVDDHDVPEDEREEESYTIIRISFSNRVGTAISFPFVAPYISLVQEALANATEVIFWNQEFDRPRLENQGCRVAGKIIDAMFAWHWLQSDLPKALAFVAPLFVLLEPWKHLNDSEPAKYSALDSAITMDCYLAIRKQLERDGRWAEFERQCVQMFPILNRMSEAGVMLDTEHQAGFKAKLEGERDELLSKIQVLVPPEVKPLKHYKREPKDMARVVINPLGGWDRVLPFNPSSPKQVKELIQHLGLSVPKVRGEDRESTEAKYLKKLAKKNHLFQLILDYRERAKLIDAYMWKVASDGRVHTSFSFHPSTWRKSSRNPNVQTVPKRNDLAAEFRRMVVAAPGHLLVECDSSAIEAVLVGYFAGSQRYIDLAKQGVHKWLAQKFAGREVSKSEPLYDQIKRVVHLSNYMGTPQRIHEEYPEQFATVREARELQEFYFSTEAGQDVRKYQQQSLELAHKEHMLETPWKQRHYFYDVFTYRNGEAVLGDDAKRAVAFRPQASASAIQTNYVLEIEEHAPIISGYLRWLVHDSIVAEVPEHLAYPTAVAIQAVMQHPIPQLGGLSIGAEAKIGPNLRDMEVVR